MQELPGWFTSAAAVVGAISGVVSLLLGIFYTGRKIGQLESKLSELDGKCPDQREWGELNNKVETLYRVYRA